MTLPKPITVAWEMGSSDWPGLDHVGFPMTREGCPPIDSVRGRMGRPGKEKGCSYQQKGAGEPLDKQSEDPHQRQLGFFSLLGSPPRVSPPSTPAQGREQGVTQVVLPQPP